MQQISTPCWLKGSFYIEAIMHALKSERRYLFIFKRFSLLSIFITPLSLTQMRRWWKKIHLRYSTSRAYEEWYIEKKEQLPALIISIFSSANFPSRYLQLKGKKRIFQSRDNDNKLPRVNNKCRHDIPMVKRKSFFIMNTKFDWYHWKGILSCTHTCLYSHGD